MSETEVQYCDGTNGEVKIFKQKCAICWESTSVYAFHQCGPEYVFEICFESLDAKKRKYSVC